MTKKLSLSCSCLDSRCVSNLIAELDAENPKNILLAVKHGDEDLPRWISLTPRDAKLLINFLSTKVGT